MTVHKRPRVVIIGAGFGGIGAARTLAHSPVEVLLLDRNNYHAFSPLFHQVAAAELEPELIAYPVRGILRKLPNVQFAIAEVKQINLAERVIEIDQSLISYDFLILGTGSTSQFLGVPGAAEYTFPLKTLQQAVLLRNHILGCFEQAVHEPDTNQRQQLLTFTIVGGGPTGVEFAGALAELIHHLVQDYPTLNFRQVRVILFQGADSLLPSLPKRLRAYTHKHLYKLGVEVHLQAKVSQVTQETVHLQDGRVIYTKTVVWATGVHGNPQASAWGLPTDQKGQVAVSSTLQVPGYPNTYVVGDLATLEHEGSSLPMLAPVAIQQGQAVARNIKRQIKGRNPLPFRYQHLGSMAIIGRHAAVAHLGKLAFTGFLAWLLWLGVHLVALVGFRNRLMVLINWIWGYLFRDRFVRLILPLNLGGTVPGVNPVSTTKAGQGESGR